MFKKGKTVVSEKRQMAALHWAEGTFSGVFLDGTFITQTLVLIGMFQSHQENVSVFLEKTCSRKMKAGLVGLGLKT